MKKIAAITILILSGTGAGCGVKKSPDIYYSHPFDFNEGFHTHSPGVNPQLPGPTPTSTPPGPQS